MLASVWYFLWACCGGCVVSAILMGMQWHLRALLSYIYRELALWRPFQVFWLSSFVNYLLKSSAWFSKCHWELQIDLCCYCYYNLLYCYYLKGRKRETRKRENFPTYWLTPQMSAQLCLSQLKVRSLELNLCVARCMWRVAAMWQQEPKYLSHPCT